MVDDTPYIDDNNGSFAVTVTQIMKNLDLVSARVSELGGNVVGFDPKGVVIWTVYKYTARGEGTVYNVHNFTVENGEAHLFWGHYDMDEVGGGESLAYKQARL